MVAVEEFGEDSFTAMIGAEAIREMLASMDLEIAGELREELGSHDVELKPRS
jgi:DNA-directed RNA polymerase subunit beta'